MSATWIRKLRFGLIAALAVLLVVLALAMSGLRLLVNNAPDVREQVEALLSEALEQPLTLGGLRAQWYGRNPRLILEDVELTGEAGSLRLESLEVEVSLWDSARTASLRPVEVLAQGLSLTLERSADGVLLHGFGELPLGQGGDGPDALPVLPARIRLNDTDLTLIDHVTERIYRFSQVQLSLESARSGLQLAGALNLPESLGRQARFRVEWQDRRTRGSGSVYLDLRAFRLHELSAFLPTKLGLPALRGRVDGELWARIEQGRLVDLTGKVALERIATPQSPLLSAASARFNWREDAAGWGLAVDRLNYVAGAEWPEGRVTLAFERGSQSRLKAYSDYLRLEDVSALVSLVPVIDGSQRQRLEAFQPRGELLATQAELVWDEAGVVDYDVRVRFNDLSLAAVEQLPGVVGVSGELHALREGGRMRLQGRGGELYLPELFRAGLPFNELDGELHWWVTPGAGWQAEVPELSLSGPDADARARVRVISMDDGAPFLDVRAHLTDGDGSNTRRYLPVGIMTPELVDWLDQAVQDGQVDRADVIVFGRLDEFPFRRGRGMFDVRAELRDVGFRYAEGWPAIDEGAGRLSFRGPRMDIELDGGSILGVAAQRARAHIDDLEQPELTLEARLRGPGSGMLQYLREIPVTEAIREQLDWFQIGGAHELELRLDLPIASMEPRIQGRVTLDQGELRMPQWGLAVQQLRGVVGFTERGVSAESVLGSLAGEPIWLRATTRGEHELGTIDVRAGVSGNPANLLGRPFLAPVFVGESNWELRLRLPAFDAGGGGVHLALESDLHGLEVQLPEPLAKPAAESRLLRVNTVFAEDGGEPWSFRYSDLLRGAVELGPEGAAIARMGLHFGTTPPILPAQGMSLSGRPAELDLDGWMALRRTGSATEGEAFEAPQLAWADLQAHELALFGQRFGPTHVRLDAARAGWDVRVEGERVAGSGWLPAQPDAGVLSLALERLYLSELDWEAQAGEAEAEAEPMPGSELPAVDITVADLRLAGGRLGEFLVRMHRSGQDLEIEALRLDGPALNLQATGRWDRVDNRTQLRARISSDDAGGALRRLGYASVIDSGSARGGFDGGWPGSPLALALTDVSGEVSLVVRNGRLPAVEPGAGRMFGLLSVAMLPRRLLFDFSDLFGRGFSFDRLSTSMQLAAGNAELEHFYIEGPAARVDLEGRIGLVARDYDQVVAITPKVSSTLPLLGGLLGGPMAAVALFVTQKLLEGEIDKLTQYRYRVTGSWEDPRIERLTRPPPEPAAPTDVIEGLPGFGR